MKKMFFIIVCLFCLIGNVYAEDKEPLKLVSIVNKCSVVKDNTIVVPVRVVSKNSGSLTSLINEYTLDYIDNKKDEVTIKITDVYGVENVFLDNNRDSNGRSLIRYYIEEDMIKEKASEAFSFNLHIEFFNDIPDKYYVLGNDIVIGSEDVCEYINGFQVNEIERVEYVYYPKINHSDMINNLIIKIILVVLGIVIIILSYLLYRKKK